MIAPHVLGSDPLCKVYLMLFSRFSLLITMWWWLVCVHNITKSKSKAMKDCGRIKELQKHKPVKLNELF